MMGKQNALSALAVLKIKKPGLTFVGLVPGLAISVSPAGTRSWILRLTVAGRRRDLGLGSFPEISLAAARDIALAQRQIVRQGMDPVAMKRQTQQSLRAKVSSEISFQEASRKYIDTHKHAWKNSKHIAQWSNTLATYAFPTIGKLHVREVTLDHVLGILDPMWTKKTETANRLRGRIEAILDWSKVRGFRQADNPARWRGNLDTLLAAPSKVSRVQHHTALAWQECPDFLASLDGQPGLCAKALKLAILTACRSGEVRGAKWSEIDLDKKIWIIPAQRMKAEREHRIPLTFGAVQLLRSIPRFDGQELVFANSKSKAFSDMSLLAVLKRMGRDVTVHGFRSSFRDWAGETTSFPREVIEHALAHQLADKTEAAYARGDLFTKRIALMDAWAAFLSSIQANHGIAVLKSRA